MKRAIGLWLLLFVFGGCAEEGPTGPCPAREVLNVGHRGTGVTEDGNAFPENTIDSFLQAQTEGAQMVELDVILSADGVLMVNHDRRVDRTTDGTGCIGDLSAAELQQFDAAVGTPLAGTGVVIPTLAEVLAAIDIAVNIEIKVQASGCSVTDRAATAQAVVDAIRGDTKGRRFTVSSFDADALTAVQTVDPNVYLGFLTLDPMDAQLAVDRGFDALNVLSLTVREPGAVQKIHDLGLEVTVWSENDPAVIEDHLTSGVDMIITDEPDVVERVRRDWCDSRGYDPL